MLSEHDFYISFRDHSDVEVIFRLTGLRLSFRRVDPGVSPAPFDVMGSYQGHPWQEVNRLGQSVANCIRLHPPQDGAAFVPATPGVSALSGRRKHADSVDLDGNMRSSVRGDGC